MDESEAFFLLQLNKLPKILVAQNNSTQMNSKCGKAFSFSQFLETGSHSLAYGPSCPRQPTHGDSPLSCLPLVLNSVIKVLCYKKV